MSNNNNNNHNNQSNNKTDACYWRMREVVENADDDFMTQMKMNIHVKYYYTVQRNMKFDKIHEKYTKEKKKTHTRIQILK